MTLLVLNLGSVQSWAVFPVHLALTEVTHLHSNSRWAGWEGFIHLWHLRFLLLASPSLRGLSSASNLAWAPLRHSAASQGHSNTSSTFHWSEQVTGQPRITWRGKQTQLLMEGHDEWSGKNWWWPSFKVTYHNEWMKRWANKWVITFLLILTLVKEMKKLNPILLILFSLSFFKQRINWWQIFLCLCWSV